MGWLKLDDGMPDHPKVIGLSDAAFRLHIRGLCYANRQLTDGFLSTSWLKSLPIGVRRTVHELVEAALWIPNESADGYRIHDYLDHQQSRGEVLHSRELGRNRVRRHRQNGRPVTPTVTPLPTLVKRNSNAVTPTITGSPVTPLVTPIEEEEEDQIPPNPPSDEGGDVSVKPPTRAERKWAEDLFNSQRHRDGFGKCSHETPCGDAYTCMGLLIGERRLAEAGGLRSARTR